MLNLLFWIGLLTPTVVGPPAPVEIPKSPASRSVAPIKGMALSPHFELPEKGMTFDRMVDEIAALGATHLSVVVQWSQPTVRDSVVRSHGKESPSDATVERIIKRAQARGLKVMIFPILWVEKRAIGEWRGTLAPADPDAWWRSYSAFILHYAQLAARHDVAVLSIGSEFASLESERQRWAGLIARVRQVYSNDLIYSANWDHYEEVTFWDLVDQAGLTGYYRLTETLDPTQQELDAAWNAVRDRLKIWSKTVGRPMVITELGYPSADGAARSPWDYTGSRSVDLEEQRRCYAAFVQAWAGQPSLAGVYFWNWFGPGGPSDTWYTPRGKPAEAIIRQWYASDPHAPPTESAPDPAAPSPLDGGNLGDPQKVR